MLACLGYVRFVAYSENIDFYVICVWFVFRFESGLEKRITNLQYYLPVISYVISVYKSYY
jgi:hypothetical protein